MICLSVGVLLKKNFNLICYIYFRIHFKSLQKLKKCYICISTIRVLIIDAMICVAFPISLQSVELSGGLYQP